MHIDNANSNITTGSNNVVLGNNSISNLYCVVKSLLQTAEIRQM